MKTIAAAAPALVVALLPAFAAEPARTPTPVPTPSHVLTTHPTPTSGRPGGSLADSVRRAKASATPVPKTKSLGVISNDSLKKKEGEKPKGTLQVGPARPIAELPSDTSSPSAPNLDEAHWRGRAAQVRERVSRAEEETKRLEAEAKRLENDFYAWSDGTYRDQVIKPAWDQAKDDLKKAREETDAANNAMADLEEEARKAGAPPGWLRE